MPKITVNMTADEMRAEITSLESRCFRVEDELFHDLLHESPARGFVSGFDLAGRLDVLLYAFQHMFYDDLDEVSGFAAKLDLLYDQVSNLRSCFEEDEPVERTELYESRDQMPEFRDGTQDAIDDWNSHHGQMSNAEIQSLAEAEAEREDAEAAIEEEINYRFAQEQAKDDAPSVTDWSNVMWHARERGDYNG